MCINHLCNVFNQQSWWMFKQLNYCLPSYYQESWFEYLRENFKFDMWEISKCNANKSQHKDFLYVYWTHFSFMKHPFLIHYANILFMYLLLFLMDEVLFFSMKWFLILKWI